MDRIRQYADFSVRRAVGFALLAIACVFVGLSNDFVLAARSVAILVSLMAAILLHCAWRAPYVNYRRREVWVLLDRWHGLPEHRAHHTISTVMRETFMRYAERGAWAAATMWLITFSAMLVATLEARNVPLFAG